MTVTDERQYLAIDLKSFYASVECVARGLDPLDACLVVADESRTDKTICLAVTPTLKSFGVPGRPRLFEVKQKLREVNRKRGRNGKSTSGRELAADCGKSVDFLVAPPRMQLYLDCSAKVYDIYLRYIAPEDIHVYSIDEVIMDITGYLKTYRLSPHDLAMRMIREVLAETGVTATAGLGTNMYLCKVAMDIVAKKMPPDRVGVRIAQLDERKFREYLWNHQPLTDFWRTGRGTAARLIAAGLHTMGDVARASIKHEDWFFKTFGVNGELIIDHAWGWEPVTMEEVKAYRPSTHSISSGQVLTAPYTFGKALVVAKEMAENVALDLVEKGLATDQIVLYVGYDVENLTNPEIRSRYDGPVHVDHYGRQVPAHSGGTVRFDEYTSSSRSIVTHVEELFRRVASPLLLVRRLNLSVNNLLPEGRARQRREAMQLDLFTDYEEVARRRQAEEEERRRERRRQQAVINVRKRFGKNALLTGLNYAEGATQRERNGQIGGHRK